MKMRRYAETSGCRMLQLVAHFGDANDKGGPCGVCDVCAPASRPQQFREPSAGRAGRRGASRPREQDGRAGWGSSRAEVFGDAGPSGACSSTCARGGRAGGRGAHVADQFVKDGEVIAPACTCGRAGALPALRRVVVPGREGVDAAEACDAEGCQEGERGCPVRECGRRARRRSSGRTMTIERARDPRPRAPSVSGGASRRRSGASPRSASSRTERSWASRVRGRRMRTSCSCPALAPALPRKKYGERSSRILARGRARARGCRGRR